jgi:hypothetical protein
MDRPLTRSQRPLHVQRRCERSRLEADLLANAYELVIPRQRQPLPAGKQPTGNDRTPQRSSTSSKGVSA